jgi:ribosomal protein S12
MVGARLLGRTNVNSVIPKERGNWTEHSVVLAEGKEQASGATQRWRCSRSQHGANQ